MQNINFAQYLQDLRKRRLEIIEKIAKEQSELEYIQSQLEQAEGVISNYCSYYSMDAQPQSLESLSEYRGLSIKDCLVRFASKNGGVLNVANAKKTLVSAGVFKDERNASTTIGSTLSRNPDMFKSLARGLYQLLPGQTEVNAMRAVEEESRPDIFSCLDEPESAEDEDDDSETEDEDSAESAPEPTISPEDEFGEYMDFLSDAEKAELAFAKFAPQAPKKAPKQEIDDLDAIFSSEDEIPF